MKRGAHAPVPPAGVNGAIRIRASHHAVDGQSFSEGKMRRSILILLCALLAASCEKKAGFIAREDIRSKWKEEPSEGDVELWIEAMKEMLADARVGERYVIIDGSLIQADAENIKFDGWAAHHEFCKVPQVRALTGKAILEEQLSNRGYWSSHALPEGE